MREGVPYFALGEDLIIADLVVATDHILSAADDLILKDVETLLQQVEFRGDRGFLLSKLRILVDLLFDSMLNIFFDLVQVILSIF